MNRAFANSGSKFISVQFNLNSKKPLKIKNNYKKAQTNSKFSVFIIMMLLSIFTQNVYSMMHIEDEKMQFKRYKIA
jgi:ABC-type sulfate transport system permease subunit